MVNRIATYQEAAKRTTGMYIPKQLAREILFSNGIIDDMPPGISATERESSQRVAVMGIKNPIRMCATEMLIDVPDGSSRNIPSRF
ncbi:MAG: hypothetical protein ACYDHW_12815 [Syntrophorhabdaceae bacterium]